jgi:phenol hydroxylase P5 protein
MDVEREEGKCLACCATLTSDLTIEADVEEDPDARSIPLRDLQTRLVELNVRRVPGGRATPWLHDALKVGDRLTFTGPFGRFLVRKSDPRPLLFLAGDSGLSSPRSMILDLLETDGDPRPITLVYGARNSSELYYHAEFIALAQRFPNFRYVPVLSEPSAEEVWDGATGYVHAAAEALYQGAVSNSKCNTLPTR